jgi:hypothetical protein
MATLGPRAGRRLDFILESIETDHLKTILRREAVRPKKKNRVAVG